MAEKKASEKRKKWERKGGSFITMMFYRNLPLTGKKKKVKQRS